MGTLIREVRHCQVEHRPPDLVLKCQVLPGPALEFGPSLSGCVRFVIFTQPVLVRSIQNVSS